MYSKHKAMNIMRPYWFLIPAFLVFGGVLLSSLIYSLVNSFYDFNMSKPYIAKQFVGLGNYIKFLTGSDFLNAFKITLIFTVSSVVIEIVLGFGIALFLLRPMMARGFVRAVILLPLMTAQVVVGTMWKVILNDQFGVLNYFISWFGIKPQTWLSDPALVLPSVIFTDIWQQTPFVILILLAGLQSLPLDVYEAATVDGASDYQKFFFLTVPLLMPLINIVVIIRTMDAFRMFDRVWMLTQGGPGMSTTFLNVFTFRQGFEFFNTGYSNAIAWVVFLIIMIMSAVYLRLLERGK